MCLCAENIFFDICAEEWRVVAWVQGDSAFPGAVSDTQGCCQRCHCRPCIKGCRLQSGSVKQVRPEPDAASDAICPIIYLGLLPSHLCILLNVELVAQASVADQSVQIEHYGGHKGNV